MPVNGLPSLAGVTPDQPSGSKAGHSAEAPAGANSWTMHMVIPIFSLSFTLMATVVTQEASASRGQALPSAALSGPVRWIIPLPVVAG